MSELPKGWVETTLGEVAEIIDGDRGKNYPNGDDFAPIGYCLFLNTKNIPDRNFAFTETSFITFEKDELLRKGKLNRGDFILTTRGTVGNYAFYSENIPYENIRINSGMVILRYDQDKGFFYHYLGSPQFKHQIISLQSGSAQPQLPIKDLRTFLVNLPPLPEQKAIAAVLSAFDDKIELLREQNETLETLAQTIFKEWFVHFNFPDQNGKPYRVNGGEMVDSELGKIPKGWRVGKLGDVIEIFDSIRVPLSSNERQKRQGIYPYYGATKIMDYIDDFLFDGTYLLFAEDGSVIDDNGYPFLQYVWGKFWVNNHAHILQGKSGFSTEALYVFLKKRKIAGIVNGAVQLKINQRNLLNLEMLLPENNVMENFNELIAPIFKKIKNNIAQIQTLSKIRDTLLPKLMSGQLRVSV